MPRIITLTTDFGTDDPFVGIMKGVILNIAPAVDLVDLTHQIEPQNLVQAAQVLGAASPYFPKKTIHLVVVDPGVGGNRRPLALNAGSQVFVGPDNGVFTSESSPAKRRRRYPVTYAEELQFHPVSASRGTRHRSDSTPGSGR